MSRTGGQLYSETSANRCNITRLFWVKHYISKSFLFKQRLSKYLPRVYSDQIDLELFV